MGESSSNDPLCAFEVHESRVRSYCRSFPTVFSSARGCRLYGEDGREYIDFFSGAGALNYGHNNPLLKARLVEYLQADGVTHSLDMATVAKRRFLELLSTLILEPRGFDYKVQFTGPTGTNAIEAALKLARKVSGREDVVCFTNAFHGMTLGSLAMTANPHHRGGAGVPLPHSVRIPYEGDTDHSGDRGLDVLESILTDAGDGPRRPAAILLETVQAEGGVRAASADWLRRVAALAKEHGVLLIVDDIQVGCGRTGRFFSFEEAGIYPDIVCLSKSIGGFGLPMAIVLLREALDVWKPGEHNGTFRGNNLAFVTAAEALDLFWRSDDFALDVQRKARRVRECLVGVVEANPAAQDARGRGLIQGIAFWDPEDAASVSRRAFAEGLIVETAGPMDEVVKILPPLVIEESDLEAGLEILSRCVESVAAVGSLV